MRRCLVLLWALVACPAEPPAPKSGAGSAPTEEAASAGAPGAGASAATQPRAGAGVALHGKSKRHTIAYVNPACSGSAPCLCKGTIDYGKNALAQIGVTPAQVAEGTPCLIGDFDGNGVPDLAFVDDKYTDAQLAARVQVLMFDEVGLMATALLPKRVHALALAPMADGRVALIEPGFTAGRYRFVYRDDRFVFEAIPAAEAKR